MSIYLLMEDHDALLAQKRHSPPHPNAYLKSKIIETIVEMIPWKIVTTKAMICNFLSKCFFDFLLIRFPPFFLISPPYNYSIL